MRGSREGEYWLLAAYLAVWQPVAFAVVASSWVSALAVRGWPLGVLLAVKLVVVGVGIAAARAILGYHPDDAPLVRGSGVKASSSASLALAALVLTMAVDLVVYATSVAPNNRMPGDTVWYVAWTLLVNGAWIAYLMRSRS